MAVSSIEKPGSWYDIYDERGKKTKTLSTNIGEIEGFSSTKKMTRVLEISSVEHFCKIKVSDSIEVYDKKCHLQQ